MKTFAKFEIVGRVGKIKDVGSTLRVSIAAEYGKRDNNGDFQSRPFWNEVTIFNENVITWAKENVATGDLVRAEGTLRQSEWAGKDGETVYGMTLAADAFDNYSHAIRKQIERASQDA
ncbi:MAG: single-stranded DNA-binding protein [Roseovarius sp.]|nr:single-stranded DNA-binding protein [Roseovarius sp.]